jgi:hypothetical protein
MPARIIVEFYDTVSAEYWTNRYFTSDPYTAAGDTIDALVAAHLPMLLNNCILTKVRVDDNVPDTDNFDTVGFNAAGTRTVGADHRYPLFNTVRVDFDVSGGGRPSRKYLRGALLEGDVNFTTLTSAIITPANTFADAIVAIGTIVDPQGNAFLDGVVWPAPQMRQLRRGSKKKITP